MKLKFSESIESLVPYKPGQSEKDVQKKYGRDFFIKLASNESPLKASDSILQAMQEAVKGVHLYPDPSCRDLRETAAAYYKVQSDHILVGNGSNELIDLLIRLFCEPGDSVLTSKGAFIAYKICAKASRAHVVETPLKDNYQIDLEAFSETLKDLDHKSLLPKLVFLPNPNNPTGSYVEEKEMTAFLEQWGNHESLVIVIDEAYNEFVEAQDFPHGKKYLKYQNVLLLKTMSKVFGLAGLRLGFLIGNPEILSYVHRIRNPFNVNSIAQAAARAALQDTEALQKITDLVVSGRKDFSKFLMDLGLKYVESQANFIFFDTGREALDVHDQFLSEGLITRPLGPYGFPQHLRITIGDREQMEQAKKVFTKVFA